MFVFYKELLQPYIHRQSIFVFTEYTPAILIELSIFKSASVVVQTGKKSLNKSQILVQVCTSELSL